MKFKYCILLVLILLLFTSCTTAGKASNNTKPAQQAASQPVIADSDVNNDLLLIQFLSEYVPESDKKKFANGSIDNILPFNPTYKQVTASYWVDYGTSYEPDTILFLLEKADEKSWKFKAICTDPSKLRFLDIGGLQAWDNIIYRAQAPIAQEALMKKVQDGIVPDGSKYNIYPSIGPILRISDTELAVKSSFWIEWPEHKDRNKRLRYQAILTQNSASQWVVKSVEPIK